MTPFKKSDKDVADVNKSTVNYAKNSYVLAIQYPKLN